MSVPFRPHDSKPLCPENHTAAEVAELLQLQPLDEEGGFFRRTAEADLILPGSDRRAYSVIYSLLTPEGFSAMHRLATDEIWCFHAGDSVESLRLGAEGKGQWIKLGLDFAAAESPQSIVPSGIWQGTRLIQGGRWALLSCIVAPEFRWEDFELGERNGLSAGYPEFARAIHELTRLQPTLGNR